MKKRIGSKLYDTDTSELVLEFGATKIYRKRTRDHEWFMEDLDHSYNAYLKPLTDEEAKELVGEHLYFKSQTEPLEYRVRLDAETYDLLSNAAKAESVPMSQIVKRAVFHELNIQ